MDRRRAVRRRQSRRRAGINLHHSSCDWRGRAAAYCLVCGLARGANERGHDPGRRRHRQIGGHSQGLDHGPGRDLRRDFCRLSGGPGRTRGERPSFRCTPASAMAAARERTRSSSPRSHSVASSVTLMAGRVKYRLGPSRTRSSSGPRVGISVPAMVRWTIRPPGGPGAAVRLPRRERAPRRPAGHRGWPGPGRPTRTTRTRPSPG